MKTAEEWNLTRTGRGVTLWDTGIEKLCEALLRATGKWKE